MEDSSHAADVSADTKEEEQLFFVPASGKDARDHLRLSISRPIATDILARLPTSIRERAQASNSHFYAWAVRPGPRNLPTWQQMSPGDWVAFYGQGLYTYVAKILTTYRDASFGTSLWGEIDGSAWELLFFLDTPQRVDVPLESVSEYLQDEPYQGFLRLSDSRKGAVLAQYDTISEFISDKFLSLAAQPANYALIRSNSDSRWEDQEDVYHYGKIANYLKLRIGTAILIDRREGDETLLLWSARIVRIDEREDGTYLARLKLEERMNRALSLDELHSIRAEPGYNVQHSIRPISARLFDQLLATAIRKAGVSEEERISSLATRLFWSKDRVAALFDLARRSKALLLSGPPGTGKTFVARALAEALTESRSDWDLVVFHPSYSYEDFLEGIRPNVTGDALSYRLHKGAALRLLDRANAFADDRAFVLIVDELNRGNVPQIFGEFLYALEYRGRENAASLPSGASLSVPESFLLVATMNTSDRSIVGLDAALRRRFTQYSLYPDYEVLSRYLSAARGESVANLAVERLKALNDQIVAITEEPAKQIGHSYLMRADLNESMLELIWDQSIEPVLSDVLFDQPDDLSSLRMAFCQHG